jgi:hypothetical protein
MDGKEICKFTQSNARVILLCVTEPAGKEELFAFSTEPDRLTSRSEPTSPLAQVVKGDRVVMKKLSLEGC